MKGVIRKRVELGGQCATPAAGRACDSPGTARVAAATESCISLLVFRSANSTAAIRASTARP
eukprot:1034790-Prymnesium_polylepis.1